MIVVIKTGWKSRRTTHVEVELDKDSPPSHIVVDVLSDIDLNPMVRDMNDTLYESYVGIAKAFGFSKWELDCRDSKTMWIWESKLPWNKLP